MFDLINFSFYQKGKKKKQRCNPPLALFSLIFLHFWFYFLFISWVGFLWYFIYERTHFTQCIGPFRMPYFRENLKFWSILTCYMYCRCNALYIYYSSNERDAASFLILGWFVCVCWGCSLKRFWCEHKRWIGWFEFLTSDVAGVSLAVTREVFLHDFWFWNYPIKKPHAFLNGNKHDTFLSWILSMLATKSESIWSNETRIELSWVIFGRKKKNKKFLLPVFS